MNEQLSHESLLLNQDVPRAGFAAEVELSSLVANALMMDLECAQAKRLGEQILLVLVNSSYKGWA